MLGSRSPGATFVALCLGLASFAIVVGANPQVAAAGSTHRAAVVVDTGGGVHKVVITFSEDSISGIDALQRAGANPVIYTFGGQGGAVCRLYGVGRDAGPGCLGGQDGDNRYWAYFRASAGTSTFTYSRAGAGATRVHDGDVEGWRFGTGTAPAFVSLASLLPPPPPPTRPPVTTPATKAPVVKPGSGGSAPGSAPGAIAGQAPAGTPTSGSTLPVTGAAGATPGSSAKPGAAATTNDGEQRSTGAKSSEGATTNANGRTVKTALASSDDGGSGSSTWSLLLFVALIVAIVIVRRVRKQNT